MHDTVAVLGAGAIGELLAGGLLRAGWERRDLVLAARRPERQKEIELRVGVRTLLDAAEAAAGPSCGGGRREAGRRALAASSRSAR